VRSRVEGLDRLAVGIVGAVLMKRTLGIFNSELPLCCFHVLISIISRLGTVISLPDMYST